MKRTRLSRRTFLRGAALGGGAVAVGLPLLEAMLNSHGTALADGTALPVRFVTWFWGNGIIPDQFYPAASDVGPNYTLNTLMQPLAPVKDYVSVASGFNNKCENAITHHEGMTVFNGYTFVQPPPIEPGFYSKAGGPTIDQVVGDLVMAQAGAPLVHSVQMGISRALSQADSGTTMHSLSHRSTQQPLPPEFNPQMVWNSVFGNFTPPDDPNKPVRLGVLGSVREDIAKLNQRIGQADKERLEAHLDGISALEAKINALPPLCTTPGQPTETNAVLNGPTTNVNLVMSDLIAYMFACDITRVASVLVLGGASELALSEAGVQQSHHQHSHLMNGNNSLGPYGTGISLMMSHLSTLLQRLKNTSDGSLGDNLLDNTVVFASSDCSTGWNHSIVNQPMLVCGKGGGRLVYPGIHLNSPNGRNCSDVTLAAAKAVTPELTEMGAGAPYSNTPATELFIG